MRPKLSHAAAMAAATSIAMTLTPLPAVALPSFSRQTGLACNSCHAPAFPTLNAFGRLFKLNGYTLTGAQAKIEDKTLSLPAILNASIFTKIRVRKSNGTDADGERTTNSGLLEFPDELAALFAGRVHENVGFLLEMQLPKRDESALAAFKMPFSLSVGGARASFIPFTTDGLGAAFGFESMNTGAVKNIRLIEDASSSSAQQYIGTATPASGAALVIGTQHLVANITRWSPVHLASTEGRASPLPAANYARVAWMPTIGAWELGIGGQHWFGTASVADGTSESAVVDARTRAWAVDAEAQGRLGVVPVGIFATLASADASLPGATPNVFNAASRARRALAVAGRVGIVPDHVALLLAYRHGHNGAALDHQDRAATVGGQVLMYQNVQLQVNYTMFSGSAYTVKPRDGTRMLTVVLAAGF